LVRALATSTVVAGVAFFSAYVPTSASISRHGSDYTEVAGPRFAVTCDKESDGNRVKGDLSRTTTGGANASVFDSDGNNANCGQLESPFVVRRHHTCERNVLTWDCDNWVVHNP
jgi:hypothetical protein